MVLEITVILIHPSHTNQKMASNTDKINGRFKHYSIYIINIIFIWIIRKNSDLFNGVEMIK